VQGENEEILRDFAFRLDARAAAVGLSQSEIASRLGTNTGRVNHWFSGRNFPRIAERVRLAELLGVNLDWLIKGEGPVEKNLQTLSEPAASYGTDAIIFPREVGVVSWSHAGQAASYEEIPKDWRDKVATTSRDRKAFGVVVEGDCMEPKYLHGDILIIEPSSEPRNGKPVVAKLKDDAVQVRIFTKMPGGKIRLATMKPEIYPTLDHSPADFHWIWPVHSMVRKE
jgi:phage repressor protein C with HTH and peptisase S24 domain